MSLYAILAYGDYCKKEGIEPTWDGLKIWYELEWAD